MSKPTLDDYMNIFTGERKAIDLSRLDEPATLEKVAAAIQNKGFIPWVDAREDMEVRNEQAQAAITTIKEILS